MSRHMKDLRDAPQSRSIPDAPNSWGGNSPTSTASHPITSSTSTPRGAGSTSTAHGLIGVDFHSHSITSIYYGSSCPPAPPSSSCSPPPPPEPVEEEVPEEPFQGSVHLQGGQSSPQVGRKLAKTWRQMGDRTRNKTRDILKKWQSLANGHAHTRSHGHLNARPPSIEELSDTYSESVDSFGLPPPRIEKKGTWKVYVWSTWVRRPYEDEDECRAPEGKIYLSDFQVEKFTYYFTDVFDHNKDRVITIEDIQALNERMRHYAGWSDDNEYYLTMKEIHADFFECLLEHVGKIEPEYGFEFDVDRIPDRVQMYQWMNMWGNLTHGAKAMVDFPIWLQILPKILFKVINRKDNGVISLEELRCFYAHFIKLKEDLVEPMTQEAYAALTSCGDFPLTERVYLMAFANFLLGKTPHGPGKYIFGGFKGSDVHPFQIDYSCLYDPIEN